MPLLCCDVGLVSELRLTAGCELMDLASPAVSGTSVYANGLNCLNTRSRGLNNFNQLLYCVSLKIYNKFANYFCELKFSGNIHQRP